MGGTFQSGTPLGEGPDFEGVVAKVAGVRPPKVYIVDEETAAVRVVPIENVVEVL